MDCFLIQLLKELHVTTAEIVTDAARSPAQAVSPRPQVHCRRRKYSRWASFSTVSKNDRAPLKRSSSLIEPLFTELYGASPVSSRREASRWHSFEAMRPSQQFVAPPSLPKRIASPRRKTTSFTTQRISPRRPLHVLHMTS